MENVKVWRWFAPSGYRWAVYVDGALHGFGVETQRQTWKQMDRDCDAFAERALAGRTTAVDHDKARVPYAPPDDAVDAARS